MFKKANLTAAAALQEIFMDSGRDDRYLDLDDSNNYPDYNDLVDAQGSRSRQRSRVLI